MKIIKIIAIIVVVVFLLIIPILRVHNSQIRCIQAPCTDYENTSVLKFVMHYFQPNNEMWFN